MRRLITVLFSVAVAMLLAFCASADRAADDGLQIRLERTVDANAPQSIKDAVLKAPKDVLVGVGNAKLMDPSMSMNLAEARARTEISRQINLVTTEIVRYYVQANKTDPSIEETFRETIKIQTSQSTLRGSSPIARAQDKDGNWWVVVTMDKSEVANQLNEAQTSAKTATPKMANFDAATLLNEAVIVYK